MRPNCSIEVSVGDGPGRKSETREGVMRIWPRLRWPLMRVRVKVIAPPGTSYHYLSLSNRKESPR